MKKTSNAALKKSSARKSSANSSTWTEKYYGTDTGVLSVDSNQIDRGGALKLAREQKGYTLESVHEATKIPLDSLKAIEEGYSVRSLSTFYYKGFVKIYAKYLDVEFDQILEESSQQLLEEKPSKVAETSEEIETPKWIKNAITPQRRQILVVLFFIFVVLFGLYHFLIRVVMHEEASNARPSRVEQPVVDLSKTGSASTSAHDSQAMPPKPRIIVPPQLRDTVTDSSVAQTSSNVSVQSVGSSTPTLNPAKDVRLFVRARKNSWLRVYVDGAIVFQSTLRTGSTESWSADREIKISGRNINELEFELNGTLIGTLGRKDRKAREVLITRDGLKVTK